MNKKIKKMLQSINDENDEYEVIDSRVECFSPDKWFILKDKKTNEVFYLWVGEDDMKFAAELMTKKQVDELEIFKI